MLFTLFLVAWTTNILSSHAVQLRAPSFLQERKNASYDNVDDIIRQMQDLPFETDLAHILQEQGLDGIEGGVKSLRLGAKPILWVHVHKAGGTFMCLLASIAGEAVVHPNDNCNLHDHDSYLDSGNKAHGLTCAERKELFASSGFSWGQIERELWESDKCWDDFNYGVMLREPLGLMRSMMNYHTDIGKGFVQDLKDELENPGEVKENQFANWKIMDNFHIRVLASAMDVPAGDITDSHLSAAKKTLSKFQAIGRLEDLPSRGEKLFSKLKWPDDMMTHVGEKVNPSGSGIDFTTEEETWLREINKYDYALYESYS